VTSVVVDASVLVACAISDGKARRAYFSATGLEFYAPEFVREELLKRAPKILAIARVPPPTLSSLFDELFGKLTIVPRATYRYRLSEAKRIVERADARGDEDYVALALVLNAPIWTYDKDFHRIGEVRVVSREQVLSGKVA
jgi:predicted nucleic acid-binding protein